MYSYNSGTRTRHARNHRDEWMPHMAEELSLEGIEKELDKLDWGDVSLDDMDDKEKKDLEKFDEALRKVQQTIMGVKARKAAARSRRTNRARSRR